MASSSVCNILLFLLPALFVGVSTAQIKTGSTISPKSSHHPYPSSWPSQSRNFEFGFYSQGNGGGFSIGIWLVGNGGKITVVWTANRNDPPITSSNATLALDGGAAGGLTLTLQPSGKKQGIVIANTTTTDSASMLDSGNFVLYDELQRVIWQSFDYPTDTLLGGQVLPSGGQLFSSASDTNFSTGRFHLKMQEDGNLVLYPINNDDTKMDAYWSSHTYNDDGFKDYLYFNSNGCLSIINGTTNQTVKEFASTKNDYQNGTIFRATLNPNGILRLYSHAPDSDGKCNEPVTEWSAVDNSCKVKGFCGLNSYCTFFDDQPNCLCLPGTDYVDVNFKTLGCLKNYSDEACSTNGKEENSTNYGMYAMKDMMWDDFGYFRASMSLQECNTSCFKDCNCGAALFDGYYCQKQRLPLRYVTRDSHDGSTTAFFKVGKSVPKRTRNETNPNNMEKRNLHFTNRSKDLMQIVVLPLGLVLFSCVSIAVSCLYVSKTRVLRYKRLKESTGRFGFADEDLALRVFSYSELKRATKGFKEELGRGSFGAVYRGALHKGKKLIAVKRLEKLIEEGEREFRAEMRAIGRTNHKNLVRLMGYCAEDSKRLLVYEYMSNGSLADILFKQAQAQRPYWDERVRIAIDVARGIHYLHEECKAPIIHCDVKPQNILMDDFWTAKISDFGLAKLLMPDQTRTFTGIRGTRGYLAPEWHQNTPITVKADVYSYGIVLLEIVCCRRNLEANVPNAEEIVLSNWVYKCFANRELNKLVVGEDVNDRTLETMVKVGLWCIQDEPVLRPSMKSVVLMLEGITDIAAPPCPTSASM